MDSIIQQINALWDKASEEERKGIHDSLQSLIVFFDTEWDLLMRMASGLLVPALAKVGASWDIFNFLVRKGSPASINEFIEPSGASLPMLRRILRALAAYELIEQTGVEEYKANRVTVVLSNTHAPGALSHIFDTLGPQIQAMPGFFNDNRSHTTIEKTDTAFSRAFNTTLSGFEWMDKHPDKMEALSHFMAVSQDSNWMEKFSVLQEFASAPPAPGDAALVDIGGGFGHQGILFHQRYPQLGHVVVQDTAQVVRGANAKPVDGVEFHPFDFFQPQPVRAKLYYLRYVLHDWNDEDCVKILKATIPAMRPNSRIVIDEVVLPDGKIPWQAAWLDIVMATSVGTTERTRSEWEALLQAAGLRIVETIQYNSRMHCAIIAVPEEAS
ncbi:S-adenosyl-L-methionine-dependent methyltransferase [Aspergillus heterothallicus]